MFNLHRVWVRNQYSLLTFMLPNAEGCCTGLQLSAKEVVLGRPDMVSLSLPLITSPPFFLSPSSLPGGWCACLSLRWRGIKNATLNSSPLPFRGNPLPLWISLLRASSLLVYKTILPSSTTGSNNCLHPAHKPPTPDAAPAAGWETVGVARPCCPHPGSQSHGAQATAELLFFPRWFFSFSLPPLLLGRQQRWHYFLRRKDLRLYALLREPMAKASVEEDPARALGSSAGGVGE